MTAKARYTEAKAALLLNVPFFAALMLDMMTTRIGKFPEVFGPHTPTMATNGIGSSAEKKPPIDSQYSGVPIQK